MKTKTLSYILIGGILAVVAIYTGALIYFTWPITEISIDKSGVFGDSFGLLTSLFSGLAFAGLIITILMQREELSLQREEIKLARKELSGQKEELKAQNETLRTQRFENTFFNMLNILESCRNDIFYQPHSFTSETRNYQGRDAIQRLFEILKSYFYDHIQENHRTNKVFKESSLKPEGAGEDYSRFYARNGDDLGQYFRTLYNTLKLIDNNFAGEQSKTYSNLLRAQLSRYELLLLFYNCLSKHGEKMAPLVKKYSLLKHIESHLLIEEHANLWSEWSEQETDTTT